ncbi:MAG: GSCFA domain-containing protein [Bacteroidetes bacterium]|nr:GSCFA domain-containing protein [Bacteroidota bacterium]
MGNFLSDYRFPICSNPNGTIYNPVSIFSSLKSFLLKENHPAEDLFEANGSWFSRQCHTKWSADSKTELEDKLNEMYVSSAEFIRQSSFLFITLGSAFVYELKETKQIVANCHRLPNTLFTKRLLSVDEIADSFLELCVALKTLNPKPKVVFTVSPVKHLRDGVEENNLSKSTLLLAIRKIRDKYPAVEYFPSFEIVNDELRDYRFYESDFAHPNKMAIDYVIERFKQTYMSERASSFVSDYSEIRAAMNHRVVQQSSNSHRNFLRSFYQRTQAMKVKYPEMDFSRELEYFNPDNLLAV